MQIFYDNVISIIFCYKKNNFCGSVHSVNVIPYHQNQKQQYLITLNGYILLLIDGKFIEFGIFDIF